MNWKKESKKNQTMEAFEEDYQCVGEFGSSFGVQRDLRFEIWNLEYALEDEIWD